MQVLDTMPAPNLVGRHNSANMVMTHASRTMMLAELELLLAAVPTDAPSEAYEEAIVNDNVLLKRTLSTRKKSFRHLRELYALDPRHPLFAVLRALWKEEPTTAPLLALLMAMTRDALLSATAPFIANLASGEPVSAETLAEVVRENHPDLSDLTLHKVGRNAAATWSQAGHLSGNAPKLRVRVQATPAACAYAMWIGFLDGHKGLRLFDTIWARMLDATAHDLDALAFAASQRGWLEYKRIANVAEFSFGYFGGLTDVGR